MYLLLRADQRLKQNHKRRTPANSSTRTVPISERSWTDIEPENYWSIAYPVSKQLSTLLRHGDLPREEDEAIEFWRLKEYFRNDFLHSQHWSDESGRVHWQEEEILYLRALQGHSGRIPLILNCRTMY